MKNIQVIIRRNAVVFFLGLAAAFVWAVFPGCSGKSGGENGKSDARAVESAGTVSSGEFPAVTAPHMISSDKDVLEYMIQNYWSGFLSAERLEKEIKRTDDGKSSGYCDQAPEPESLSVPQVLGVDSVKFDKAFAGYIRLLSLAEKNIPRDSGLINRSVAELFRAADSLYALGEKNFLLRLMDLGERYLYHPNSPGLNEELYIPFVDNIVALNSLDSLSKLAYTYQSRIVHLNRKGFPAGDFEFAFTDKTGIKRKRLYDIKADYVLLYFNNPDCHSCKTVSEKIKNIPVLREMTGQGNLKVVAMYMDTDLDLWRRHAGDYPANWIYAYDPFFILRENEIYGLRAIPSLYLLDKDKRVILKDAKPEAVAEQLRRRN